jgi:hypothetical protein
MHTRTVLVLYWFCTASIPADCWRCWICSSRDCNALDSELAAVVLGVTAATGAVLVAAGGPVFAAGGGNCDSGPVRRK